MKTQVKNLKPGDDLGTCVILDVRYIGTYCGQKDRANVHVRYSNGKESWRIWGWLTTVTVK
jgi:hypothetical protein